MVLLLLLLKLYFRRYTRISCASNWFAITDDSILIAYSLVKLQRLDRMYIERIVFTKTKSMFNVGTTTSHDFK